MTEQFYSQGIMYRIACFLGLIALSWAVTIKNCDNKNILTFNKVDVSPVPVMFPGTLNVDADVTLNTEVGGNIDIDLSIKKVLGFVPIPIPCISNVGSCTYKNACELLKKFTCPAVATSQDIPCSCPFKAGRYTFKLDGIQVPEMPSSISWLATGEYEATARIKQNGVQIGCVSAVVKLDKPCEGWLCGRK